MSEYDDNNVFAKIIRSEIKSDILYEDGSLIVIHDIRPLKKIHLLFIPKKNVINYDDFIDKSSDKEICHFFRIIRKIIKDLDINNNYKLQVNSGIGSGQEVMHFHMHLISDGA